MKFEIIILNHFKSELKKYIKKYKDLKNDVICDLNKFDKNNSISLWNWIFKLRIKSSNLEKWKSGWFRLLILLLIEENYIVPLTIFSKWDKSSISQKEINYHLKKINSEL